MAIYIEISNRIVGRTWLYEYLGRTGRKRLVPTYQSILIDTDGCYPDYIFAVTRDASDVVFGHICPTSRYGANTECPPSRSCSPYYAAIHDPTTAVPFGLRLYETGYKDNWRIRGDGIALRTAVLIHHGPARTEGCFTVAGGASGFRQFRKHFDQVCGEQTDPTIRVDVQPRPKTDLIYPGR